MNSFGVSNVLTKNQEQIERRDMPYFKTLPQPLTASQATVRASYWARKRTDEPDGFIIYFCEDAERYYVVGYSQSTGDYSHLYQDFDIVDIVEPSARYGSATDTNGTRIVWHHK